MLGGALPGMGSCGGNTCRIQYRTINCVVLAIKAASTYRMDHLGGKGNKAMEGGVNRRDFLKKAGLAGIALVGAACAPAASQPTPAPKSGATPAAAALTAEQIRAQLYEAAKKEREIMIYGPPTYKPFLDAFAKAYPGIEIKDFAGSGEAVLEKLLTELKAGKVLADAFSIPLEQWVVAHEQGLGEKWDQPEKDAFPPDAIDPKGIYMVETAVVHVISYNTRLVPAGQAPKNYQDLLNPIFKGKLGLEREGYSWFTQRMAVWGKDKAVEYAKKLAGQAPIVFIKGHPALLDAVVRGEVWAAVNTYLHQVVPQKEKGAPVDFVAEDPTGAEPMGVAVAKGTPHPNAAKLFVAHRLSQKGQEVGRDLLWYPPRKDVTPHAELQKIRVALPSVETSVQTRQNAPLFKEIFGLV